MQEKFRQAGENLDDLNRWLERVEREIASQEIPQENVDSLKNQIKSLKVSWSVCHNIRSPNLIIFTKVGKFDSWKLSQNHNCNCILSRLIRRVSRT